MRPEKSVRFIERVKLIAVLHSEFFFLPLPVHRTVFLINRLVFFVILGIPDELPQRLHALLLIDYLLIKCCHPVDLSTEFIDGQDILISEKRNRVRDFLEIGQAAFVLRGNVPVHPLGFPLAHVIEEILRQCLHTLFLAENFPECVFNIGKPVDQGADRLFQRGFQTIGSTYLAIQISLVRPDSFALQSGGFGSEMNCRDSVDPLTLI